MSSASTERDLILTTAHAVNYDYVAPLLLSLKRTGYRGKTVMFISSMDAASVAKIEQAGVIVMPFQFKGKRRRQRLARIWPLWRWLFSTGASIEWKEKLAHRVFHLVYRRYLLYLDFLRARSGQFDRIFLADSRDVFFQSDPFAWNITPGLHYVLEENNNRIGGCRLHRRWMSCQFGSAYVDRNAQKKISCSGTVYGGTADIMAYLARMTATFMTARNLAKIDGGDQGIHNYLFIEKLLNNLTVHENRCGPVLTMGVMPPAEVQINEHNEVLNADGSVVPVLHQYDRIPGLKERLVARLGDTRN